MPVRRRLDLLVPLLLISVFLSGWRLDAETLPAETDLVPGIVHERHLAVGETHSYRLQLETAGGWWIEARQLGIDVELVASWPGVDESWRVDSPIDWDGTELLLLPSEAVGTVNLEVRARGTRLIPSTRSGPYRIRLERVDPERSPIHLEALAAMTRAGRAWAAGSGEDRRRALDHYLAAVELWRELQKPHLGAQSLYSAAVLHRLLGESEPALELARRVLPLWRALRDRGREADTLNEIGLLETSLDRHVEARSALADALEVQQRQGDLYRQVATSNNLCRTYNKQGLRNEARTCFERALGRARAAGDSESEAVILLNLGWVAQLLGRPEEAFERYHQALEIHRRAGRTKRVAETLHNLASLHRSVDEQEEALELYLRALEVFRALGNGRWEARTLHNLGFGYHALGDPERAITFLERALVMRRQLGDRAGEAVELRSIGSIELRLGRPTKARELFDRSLEIERAAGNLAGEAKTWSLLGEASAALGEPDRALELFDASIERLRQLDARPALARALDGKGESLLTLDRPREARSVLDASLVLHRKSGQRRAEAHTLYLLAESHRATGDSDRALRLVREAIREIESIRAEIGDADLSGLFAGARRDSHELLIDLLMERGAVREALEANERARARSLLELMRQAGHGELGEEGSELRKALRSARRTLHLRAGQRRKALAGRASSDGARDEAEANYLLALAELERLEAEARRTRGAPAEAEPFHALEAGEIRALLDPSTALVEFSLGRARSFAFLVTSTEIRAFELPPRDQLESAVRRLHRSWASAHDDPKAENRLATELSGLLLAPWVGQLIEPDTPIERLVVVADGALHYLPFGALPWPENAATHTEPLIQRWQVVHLPSAGALAALRQRRAERRAPPLTLAVFADPVFDPLDPRSKTARAPETRAPGTGEAPRPASQILRRGEGFDLPRLRSSRQEAERIAELAKADPSLPTPPGETENVLVALDFAADRERVLGSPLDRYRILHFATHGVIDSRYPALSGLVLSMVDEQGRPTDGFLRLRDIHTLELTADLVVLSACRTALGKEVRGEGLVGLTRGFLHAGASRVLASLWPVSDRATTELMVRFYRAHFEEQLSPPAALRRAQLSMQGERRWRDPHYWSGFVVVGDWHEANHPIP